MLGPAGTTHPATRAPYAGIAAWLSAQGPETLGRKRAEAEALFRRIGITFAVYGEGGDPERLIPSTSSRASWPARSGSACRAGWRSASAR
jgi:uncharacterized circularly permuted ATP-grasp superfamily protein